jgi:predicted P-loop ATPase
LIAPKFQEVLAASAEACHSRDHTIQKQIVPAKRYPSSQTTLERTSIEWGVESEQSEVSSAKDVVGEFSETFVNADFYDQRRIRRLTAIRGLVYIGKGRSCGRLLHH